MGRKARTCDVISFKTDVLLLDEPAAGISVEEVPAILQVIENIRNIREHNCTYRTQNGYDTRFVRSSYRFISWRVIG